MNINRIHIRFLRTDERMVLKSIRLNKQIGSRLVWADLFYTRDIAPDYVPKYIREKTDTGIFFNTKTVFPQDAYDELVLKAVRTKYPDVEFSNLDVNIDSCIERLKNIYGTYHKEQAIVYLTPNLSQIDPMFVPVGSRFTQFRLYIDLYTPCREFINYFNNEGFFDDYNIADAEEVDKLLDESLPTVHHINELWKKNENMNNQIKTAVIMAAGMGTRFGEQTELQPKGFIPFKGKPMVIRAIETMFDAGIEKVIIGTGYHKEFYEALEKEYPGKVQCVFSPRFAETNSMYTLWNCRQVIGDADFLLFESDLVFEKKAVTELINCSFDSAMLITPVTKFQDQYYVQMNEKCELINCSVKKEEITPSGELVGIHKIGNSFYKILCSEYEKIVNEKPKLGYEFQLLDVSQRITPMHVLKLNDLQWYEIDDEQDLKYAEENIKIK